MWTTHLCSTVTGDKLVQLDLTALQDLSWSRRLNGIGTGSLKLDLESIGTGSSIAARRDDRRRLLTPWDVTVVRSWQDASLARPLAVYAGILINPDYHEPTGALTFSHAELREIFKSRHTFGVDGYTPKGKVVYENESLASLAGRLVRLAVEGPRANYRLPIVLPAVGMPGPASRTWFDYNLNRIEDELVEVQNDEGGPDVDFLPRWSDQDRLEWVPRIGTLTGSPAEWNLAAPDSPVTGFALKGNADQQANVIYATGEGSEEKLPVRSGWQTTDTPALERAEAYSQVRNGRVLQSHADALVLSQQKPVSDWELSIQADAQPGIADLALGQQHRVYTQNDPWVFDGWKDDLRLVGFSGNLTNTIALQLQ